MKILEFLKDKLTISILEILTVIILVGVLFFSFLYSRLNSENSRSLTNITYARSEKNPETYFDAVLLGYNPAKNSIQIEVTKDGFTRRQDQTLSSKVKISFVSYDSKTLKVLSKKDIKPTDLKSGDSVRLFITKSTTDFDLSGLNRIEVLEGK
mgnify:FL=1